MRKMALFCMVLCASSPLTTFAAEQFLPADVVLDRAALSHNNLVVAPAYPGMVYPTLAVVTQVVPDPTRLVHLHPAGSGKVVAVLVQPGTRVTQGQALLRYQDHALHAARLQAAQAQAALSAAFAARQDAAQAVHRAQQLVGQSVSVAELRRRQDVLAQAEASVRVHQADVDTLGHRFNEEFNSVSEQSARQSQNEISTLISPLDGVVQTLDVSVAADLSASQEVVTVADLSCVWLVSDILPEQAHLIQTGGQQITTVGAQPVVSRIDTVEGLASPLTGLLKVISHVTDPAGRLVPGMVLNATLSEKNGVSGLIVPSQAVQTINGRSVVFVRKDATHYRPVEVDVALDNGEQAVIHAGLQEGESVVGQGSFVLRSVLELAGMDAD